MLWAGLVVWWLVLPCAVWAASSTVSLTGQDTNPGTTDAPWRTIQHAVNIAQPGDTITVQPGVYHERVVVKTKATALTPLVIEGARTADGDWLTVIDGSDLVTARWEPAPSVGPGVYRAILPYEPSALFLDGPQCATNPEDCSKTIWRIGTDAMYQRQSFAVGQSNASWAGLLALAKPAHATIIPYGIVKVPAPYWQSVGALFGHLNGWVYLRFAAGTDPNTLTLRSSPGPRGQFARPTTGAAIMLDGATHVTVRGLRLRGARQAVLLENGAAQNVVEYNHLSGGQARVRLGTGAAQNSIRHNVLRAHHVSGWLPGARTETLAHAPIDRVVNWTAYFVNKFTVGDGAEDDRGMFLWQSGPGNRLHDNDIGEGGTGIALLEQAPQTHVYRNSIHHMASQGMLMGQGMQGVEIYDNLIYDNGINLRIQELDYNNLDISIYRNRFWNPYGQHLFLAGNTPISTARIALYHNSFSGPQRPAEAGAGDRVADLEVSDRLTTATNVLVLNNIFGSMRTLGMEKLGIVAANLLPPGYPLLGNTVYAPKPWGDTLPAFATEVPGQARDAGIDLARPFIANGRALPALPGMVSVPDGKPDIGAVEFVEPGGVPGAPRALQRVP